MEPQELTIQDLLTAIMAVNSRNKTQTLGDCIQFELDEALQRVNEHKADAELNIKLKIKHDDRQQIMIFADVSKKVPKGTVKKNFFYIGHKGELLQDDPDQLKLIDTRKVVEHKKGATND